MPDTDIICKRCGKPARIQAEGGVYCLPCWRLNRKEKREIKEQDSLNHCFSFKSQVKMTKREEELVDEIMRELNDDTKVCIKPKAL